MRKKFKEWSSGQSLMFPPCVDDFVPRNHVVHFIKCLVREELDLCEIEGEYGVLRGAPPYSPAMMTGILLYSYMRAEYSSRRIARACEERLDFIVLTGLNYPDFRTISNFRKRHHKALSGLFSQIVRLCAEAGLVRLQHVAIDGTKIKANAAADCNKSYARLKREESAIEQSISDWFDQAEVADADEDAEYGEDERGDVIKNADEALARIREAKKRIEERDRKEREEQALAEQNGSKPKSKVKLRTAPKDSDCYNSTDPDSRMMKSRQGFVQAFNAQIAVDSQSYVIVSQHVSTARNDRNELLPTITGIAETCGKIPHEVSADSDYCSEANFILLHKKKVRGYFPVDTSRGPPAGKYTRKMLSRVRKGGKRSRYHIRQRTVEPVFGVIKAVKGFRQFALRGLKMVSTEWALVCSAQNLWKLFKIQTA